MEGLCTSLLLCLMVNDFIVIYNNFKILQISLYIDQENVDLPVLKTFIDPSRYLSRNERLLEILFFRKGRVAPGKAIC